VDPDANLKEQLELARQLLCGEHDGVEAEMVGDRLAELVLSLHEWIGKGGFLPRAWERKKNNG